jgi:hypothetical protein
MNRKSFSILAVVSAVGFAFARVASAQGETIGLSTPDGKTTETLECSCTDLPVVGCVIGHRVDKDVIFVLPPGYTKGQFSSEVQPTKGINSGGRVTWLNDDPHDARVHLHCWADAFSGSRVSVSQVTGTRE